MKNPLHLLLNMTRRLQGFKFRRGSKSSVRLGTSTFTAKPKSKLRLPSIRFPHVPFRFKKIRTVLRKTLALMLLLVSGAGFYVLIAKPWPMPLIHGYFPILGLESTQFYSWLRELYTEDMIWRSAIGTMSFALVASLILLVQRPMSALVALYRGIKASPMAMLRSPMAFYRRVVKVRNWILEKVDYLNSESAKWKTTFNIMKSPYSLLRTLGFSPQMAAGLLFAGSTVGGGVIVNETILAERSFTNGDPGVYAAPGNVPVSYVTDPEQDGYNTLRIDLGATSVREITIENVSVGTVFTGSALPSGQQNVVDVGGNVVTGGTNTRLEIGHLIFEKSRCKKLTLSDIQTHTLIVRGNARDGQSIAPSAGTSRMRAIGGGHHQADAMVHSGGTFDRIWIQAPSSGVNGKIGTLKLSNLYTKGGECVLTKINAGTIEILLNEVGMGNGFATKEFVIATNVTAANMTIEDNVEVTIAEPATQ